MKSLNVFVVPGFLLLACVLFSCKKNGTNPNHPVDPPGAGTMRINWEFPGPGIDSTELIISEAGGKVLLDTIGINQGNFVVNLRTDQKLLDITEISYSPGAGQYVINTRRNIDPSTWSSIVEGEYNPPLPYLPPVTTKLVYTHVPPISYSYLWVNDFVVNYGINDVNGMVPNTINLTYGQCNSSNYIYTLFPASGLYNFYLPKGLADTIDLSHMDTAVELNFNQPAIYTRPYYVNLIGFLDTTDYSKCVALFGNGIPGSPDIEYPRKHVQKMELYTSSSFSNGTGSYYSYADSVPSTLPLLDESSYTVTSKQNTNFSVKISASHPTYCFSYWSNAKIHWYLNYSPDSTTFNPLALLTSLKSKKLQGLDLTSLSYGVGGFAIVGGFDYAGLSSYLHNPALLKTKRVTSETMITKNN